MAFKLFLNRQDRINYLGFDDRWAAVLFIPLLATVAFILFVGQKEDATNAELFSCYFFGLIHTVVYWVGNRFWVIQLRMRYPKQEQTIKRIVLMLVFAVTTVLAFEQLSDWLINNFYPQMLDQGWDSENDIFAFMVSITLCLLVLAMYESIYFFTKYRQSLIEQERLAKANMQAQLTALKQQVNPHFLFNSLNTLANVIPENPAVATRFVHRLAAVYRRVLEYRHQELIPLRDEIIALSDYIYLLKIRFEGKLKITISYQLEENEETHVFADASGHLNLPDTLSRRKVVPLALQLLVENAVKHNIVSEEKPLTVRIKIAESGITVTNNLQLRPRVSNSTGLGQQNIRQRYRLLTDQRVRIHNTPTSYHVSIPLLTPQTSIRYATA